MALPTKFKHSLAVEDAAILVLEAMEGELDCPIYRVDCPNTQTAGTDWC